MKLPKAKNKVAILVASGIVITSAATAGALMIAKPFDNPQKASVETTQQDQQTVASSPSPEPEVTTEPVEPTTSPSPTPTPSQGPTNTFAEDSMGYYVFNKRVEAGKVVGNWGLASSWPTMAKEAGLVVDRNPQKYDAAIGGLGIWFVESVNDDGSFIVSSYNAGTYGPGKVTRTVPAVQTQVWQFIH